MGAISGTIGSLGEDGLISIFSVEAGSLGNKLLVPNGDDAAAWFVAPKYASVITTDTLVEGVHFDRAYCSPRAVGRKLISVNLSDIAAMGAYPRYALLSVCLPPQLKIDVAQQMASGIRETCKKHGVAIIGGNTAKTAGPIILTATLIGRAEPAELVTRRGTQLGDAIFVTGHLGDANGGLRLLQEVGAVAKDHPMWSLSEAQVDPEARAQAGRALARGSLCHAMCDISDGFGQDLRRLLVPETLGARIEADKLPISAALRAYADGSSLDALQIAMQGGEDYELLFTADPHDERPIIEACAAAATPVARVGVVTQEPDFEVLMPDGSVAPLPMGFSHF